MTYLDGYCKCNKSVIGPQDGKSPTPYNPIIPSHWRWIGAMNRNSATVRIRLDNIATVKFPNQLILSWRNERVYCTGLIYTMTSLPEERLHPTGLKAAKSHVVSCQWGEPQSYSHRNLNSFQQLAQAWRTLGCRGKSNSAGTWISALWHPEQRTKLNHAWIPNTWTWWGNNWVFF